MQVDKVGVHKRLNWVAKYSKKLIGLVRFLRASKSNKAVKEYFDELCLKTYTEKLKTKIWSQK